MAIIHGKSTVVTLNGTISAYVDNADIDWTYDESETTTFGASGGARTFTPGNYEGKIALKGKWDPAVDVLLRAILGVAATTATVKPGNSTYTYTNTGGFLKDYKVNSPVGGVITWSGDYRVSGPFSVS